MFGTMATAHLRLVAREEADAWVTENTKIVASRASHERLAKLQFPGAAEALQRYGTLDPGKNAILISYRGPPAPDTGIVPDTGTVLFYLIEVEEYQEK